MPVEPRKYAHKLPVLPAGVSPHRSPIATGSPKYGCGGRVHRQKEAGGRPTCLLHRPLNTYSWEKAGRDNPPALHSSSLEEIPAGSPPAGRARSPAPSRTRIAKVAAGCSRSCKPSHSSRGRGGNAEAPAPWPRRANPKISGVVPSMPKREARANPAWLWLCGGIIRLPCLVVRKRRARPVRPRAVCCGRPDRPVRRSRPGR